MGQPWQESKEKRVLTADGYIYKPQQQSRKGNEINMKTYSIDEVQP